MNSVTFYGATDVGRVRKNNEDTLIAQYIWDKSHILAVAIDGVGGYEGGEVAAELARSTIIAYLENYPNGERADLLKQAVVAANNTICAERKKQPQYADMSCVLTAALIEVEERRINMAHVGDTRLYQFANGILTKLSHDHSLVGYREEIGELTEEEAMHHPQRNIIGRDVGSTLLENGTKGYVETATFPLLAHSMLLLCSDGLCDMITSAQMSAVLRQDGSVQEKVQALIGEANAAGGRDNVTVVLVDVDLEELPQAYSREIGARETDKPCIAVEQPAKGGKGGRGVKIALLCSLAALAVGFLVGMYAARPTAPAPESPKQAVDEVPDPNEGIRKFISEYYDAYKTAETDEEIADFFATDNVAYFSNNKANREAILKDLTVHHKDRKDKNIELNESSLQVIKQDATETIVVYMFDMTDSARKQRIFSEMVVTTPDSDRKIKSIQELKIYNIELEGTSPNDNQSVESHNDENKNKGGGEIGSAQ